MHLYVSDVGPNGWLPVARANRILLLHNLQLALLYDTMSNVRSHNVYPCHCSIRLSNCGFLVCKIVSVAPMYLKEDISLQLHDRPID